MRILLIVAAVAAGAFLIWKYYQGKQQSSTGSGPLGTNLNSVAPELVGGSTGPSLGPAVNLPINITLTEPINDQGNSSSQANPATMQTASGSVPAMNGWKHRAQQQPGVTAPTVMVSGAAGTSNSFTAQSDAAQAVPQSGWHA